MRLPVQALLSALLLVLVLGAPRAAVADEPEPVHRYSDDRLPPPNAKVQTMLTGAAVTAGFYLPALGASFLWSDVKGAEDLRIPVVGPWLQVGQTQLCSDLPREQQCQTGLRIIGAILAGLDGVGQAGGVLLFLDGLLMRTAPLEATNTARNHRIWLGQHSSVAHGARKRPWSLRRGDFEVTAVPLSTTNMDLGLSVFGTF